MPRIDTPKKSVCVTAAAAAAIAARSGKVDQVAPRLKAAVQQYTPEEGETTLHRTLPDALSPRRAGRKLVKEAKLLELTGKAYDWQWPKPEQHRGRGKCLRVLHRPSGQLVAELRCGWVSKTQADKLANANPGEIVEVRPKAGPARSFRKPVAVDRPAPALRDSSPVPVLDGEVGRPGVEVTRKAGTGEVLRIDRSAELRAQQDARAKRRRELHKARRAERKTEQAAKAAARAERAAQQELAKARRLVDKLECKRRRGWRPNRQERIAWHMREFFRCISESLQEPATPAKPTPPRGERTKPAKPAKAPSPKVEQATRRSPRKVKRLEEATERFLDQLDDAELAELELLDDDFDLVPTYYGADDLAPAVCRGAVIDDIDPWRGEDEDLELYCDEQRHQVAALSGLPHAGALNLNNLGHSKRCWASEIRDPSVDAGRRVY